MSTPHHLSRTVAARSLSGSDFWHPSAGQPALAAGRNDVFNPACRCRACRAGGPCLQGGSRGGLIGLRNF